MKPTRIEQPDPAQRIAVPELEQPGLTLEDILRIRRAKGGRAQDRIGKRRSYVRHETAFGGAAARRRRQILSRTKFICAACEETHTVLVAHVISAGQLVCADCIADMNADAQLPTSPRETVDAVV